MELEYVDLKNFGARDNAFKLRYFKQFSDLVSQRLPEIRKAHEANDREQLWRNLHGARPQLLFFGIEKVKNPMEQIEMSYATMDQAEIDEKINMIVQQLEGALKEIQALTAKIEMEGP